MDQIEECAAQQCDEHTVDQLITQAHRHVRDGVIERVFLRCATALPVPGLGEYHANKDRTGSGDESQGMHYVFHKRLQPAALERKSFVKGKSGYVSVDIG